MSGPFASWTANQKLVWWAEILFVPKTFKKMRCIADCDNPPTIIDLTMPGAAMCLEHFSTEKVIALREVML